MMPRLQIRLPTELGNVGGDGAGARQRGNERSRPLGTRQEDVTDSTRRVLRWHGCWATGEG